jgi:hypothetical protein
MQGIRRRPAKKSAPVHKLLSKRHPKAEKGPTRPRAKDERDSQCRWTSRGISSVIMFSSSGHRL